MYSCHHPKSSYTNVYGRTLMPRGRKKGDPRLNKTNNKGGRFQSYPEIAKENINKQEIIEKQENLLQIKESELQKLKAMRLDGELGLLKRYILKDTVNQIKQIRVLANESESESIRLRAFELLKKWFDSSMRNFDVDDANEFEPITTEDAWD